MEYENAHSAMQMICVTFLTLSKTDLHQCRLIEYFSEFYFQLSLVVLCQDTLLEI